MNGISRETGWSTAWPARGPKVLWKASVGTGFSAFAVAAGRVYTLGNQAEQETVFCFDAGTGASVWRHTYACELDPRYYEGGPSSTPTVDGERVYTLSRKGHLHCLDAAKGNVIWVKLLNEELGLKQYKTHTPEWGYAGSPLVLGDKLIVNVGTAGTALDKKTGRVLWRTGDTYPGYSTPVPMTTGEETVLVVFGANAVMVVGLADGSKVWEYPWETSYDVNAADPIISGNKIFISSGYGHGCALLELNGKKVTKLWENKHMRNQLNSSVLWEGHLYGLDGDSGNRGSKLHCLEFATGQLKWSEASLRPGGLMAADGKLIVLGDSGELVVAEANPAAFKPLARAQVLGGKCWTVPVLSGGRIYCRNVRGDVVCLDVSSH